MLGHKNSKTIRMNLSILPMFKRYAIHGLAAISMLCAVSEEGKAQSMDNVINTEDVEDVDILPPLSTDFEYMRSPNVDESPKGPKAASFFLQSESKRRLSQESLCSYEMKDVLNMVGVEARRAANQREELRKKSAIIKYEPTDNWFSTPIRAWHVDHNRKIVLIFFLFNAVVVLLARFTNICGVIQEDVLDRRNRFCDEDTWIFMEDHVLSAISFGLFLLMAFRANNAYDRFWEARPLYCIRGDQSFQIEAKIEELKLTFRVMKILPPKKGQSRAKGEIILKFLDASDKDFVVIQAIKFPMIHLVWLGSIMMMVGLLMGIFRRIKKKQNYG